MRRASLLLLLLALAVVLLQCGDGPTEAEEDFKPTANTELQDTVSFTSVSIPAGVTVTVTSDLVVKVTGSVSTEAWKLSPVERRNFTWPVDLL